MSRSSSSYQEAVSAERYATDYRPLHASMASKEYLFVNKHSNSPSLSRNTGAEFSLASRVNKHVQQQRFHKDLGTRRNWYRPFVRSESTTSSPNSRPVTPSGDEPEEQNANGESQALHWLPSMFSDRSFSPYNLVGSNNTPRSGPQEFIVEKEYLGKDYRFCSEPSPTRILASRPGDCNDPFNRTVIPLTPTVMELIQRHLKWAISSSVTEFVTQEGCRRILSTIMQNRMHTAAFLAFATAQLNKTSDARLPQDHSPELYSYKAIRLIRQHIETHSDAIDPYVLLDIFRLALCEWIGRNHRAARIHFSYIAQHWHGYDAQSREGQHNVEVMSCEDVFLAVDLDEKPLLALTWESNLRIGPHAALGNSPCTGSPVQARTTSAPLELPLKDENGENLFAVLNLVDRSFGHIAEDLFAGLKSFPNFSGIDFTAATVGPIWTMKRRMQATLHRIQSLDIEEPSITACIRRTLVILLTLASTSPARRVGRTDMARVALRLQNSLKAFGMSAGSPSMDRSPSPIRYRSRDSGLWLWMCATGLVAASEDPLQTGLIHWFSQRMQQTVLQQFGTQATMASFEGALSRYLFFQHVFRSTMGQYFPFSDQQSTQHPSVDQ